MRRVRGGLSVGALSALFLFMSPATAYADTNYSPAGWDVQINSWTYGPEQAQFTVTVPSDTSDIKVYLYEQDDVNGYSAYETQDHFCTPDSNDQVTFSQADLKGGTPTYIKMTVVENGVESQLPNYFFIISEEQRVHVDNWADAFSVSQTTINQLQQAITNLQNATGVGDVTSAGTALQNGLDGISNYSGQGSGDLSFTIPIIHSQYGNVDATLFSADELSKLTWLSTVNDVLVAGMWIMFVVWAVGRFSPSFKV